MGGITADMSRMSDAEVMDQAYFLKGKGREYFEQQLFAEAAERYREAAGLIDNPKFNMNSTLPAGWEEEAAKLKSTSWLNEAQCELKLERYHEAIACANKALELDPKNVKALFRRGNGHMGNQDYPAALKDLGQAHELLPSDVHVKNMLAMCRSPARRRPEADGAVWRHVRRQEADNAGRFRTSWVGPLPTVCST